jgi:predicted ester cyclase
MSVGEMPVSMKDKMRRILHEAFGEGRLDSLDELLHPDFVNHNAPPGIDPGIEGVKEIIRMEHRGVPDLKYTVLHDTEDGDLVYQHALVTGTHLGPFMGVEPTGRQVSWREMHVARIQDGRCIEHWGVADTASLWVQIGRVAPVAHPPEAAAS